MIAIMKKPKYYIRPDGLHETIKTINGKRVAFRGKTDAEVDKKLLAYKGEVSRGRLFEVVADEWKTETWESDKLGYNTKQRAYAKPYERIVERFADTPIKNIVPRDVENWLKSLEKRYSQKSIQMHKLIANRIFSHAVLCGDRLDNPCIYVRPPKGTGKTIRELPTDEDVERVKSGLSLPGGLLHYFVLYTGLRRGEVLGLCYGDIDRVKKVLHVRRSMYYESSAPKTKEPKTAAGIRSLPIPDILLERLPKGKAEDRVFPTMQKTTFEKLLQRYHKQCGISCTLHQLRHGYATMLYDAGVDVKTAQYYLGHTSIKMTMDLYTHISERRKNDSADKLNKHIATQKIHSVPN